MLLRSILAACAVGALACPRPAFAHGQVPVVRDVQFVPGAPSRIVAVAEAAGLFTSNDTGKTWSFVCSQSYAIDPYVEGIPPVAVLRDGVIAVATGTSGLRLSADAGCNFARPGDFDGSAVVDAASNDGVTLHVLSYRRFDDQLETTLRVSGDAGKTFAVEGTPQRAGIPLDLALASGSPDAFYVLEKSPEPDGPLGLRASADRGTTWSARALPPLDGVLARARIAAVNPDDPAVVYLITGHSPAGTARFEHALWLSTTGGSSWTRVLSSETALTGPVYDPTHTSVAFGGTMGVYRAREQALAASGLPAATLVAKKSVYALAWAASGLYAGTNNFVLEPLERFAVGVAEGDSGAFSAVLSLCDLEPLQCLTGSTAAQCGRAPHVLQELASSPICGPAEDAGAPSVGPPPVVVADSGAPPPPPVPRPESPDAGPAPAEAVRHESGCSVGARADGDPGILLAALAAVSSWLRKRRPNARRAVVI